MAAPAENAGSMEDSMAIVEEWMFFNTFLVDLEESFTRWRLIETALPAGDALKLYLQNSLQATGKLRAIYLAHEDKRVDTEQQLRSWVNKVEAQIGDLGKKHLNPKRWTVSQLEPLAYTGMPGEVANAAAPSATNSSTSTPSPAPETTLPSGKGNIFVMEDYFASEKPVEMLMTTTCPQLMMNPEQSRPQSLPTATAVPTLKSLPSLNSLGLSSATIAGTLAKPLASSLGSPASPAGASSTSPAAPATTSPTATGSSSGTVPGAATSQTSSTGAAAGLNVPGSSGHKRVSSGGKSDSVSDGVASTPSTPHISAIKSSHHSSSSPTINTTTPTPQATSFTHLLVEINDLIMSVGQEAVMTLSLFADDRFITEEYPISLPNQSPIVLEDRARKVLFRDIPSEAVYNNLWMIVRIIRFGKMKFNEAKPSAKDSYEGYPVRRPYAVAAISITECLAEAQTEQDVQDAINSAPGNSGAVAAAKAATLRRRQFSNAPRPTGASAFQQDGAPDSSEELAMHHSSSPGAPSAASSRKLNSTLRQSAFRHNNGHHETTSNTLSMRALNYVNSSNQFVALHGPARDDLFPDAHSYIIHGVKEKAGFLTYLPKAKGLLVSISRFEGAFAAIQHHPALLAAAPVSVAQPLFLPDQGSSTETLAPRNDLYVTLEDSFLHDDKSYEIVVEARNKFGAPANVNPATSMVSSSSSTSLNEKGVSGTAIFPCPALPIFSGPNAASSLSIVHRSIPYYHKRDPKPMESFKMDLSRFSDVDHLYITMRHISESGKYTDLAFSTLRLYQQDASFIPNGTRKLNTYKPGGNTVGVADLLAKRGTVASGLKPGGPSASNPAAGGADDQTWYLKNEETIPRTNKTDYLAVNVNLVSTKITENIPLRALLNWQNSTMPDMSPLLEKCAHLSRKDIVNFYKDIFDTLLDLLVLLNDVRPAAFQTLLAILATCQQDPRNAQYDSMDPRGHSSLKHWVDRYLDEGMTNGKAYPFLMDLLHKLVENVSSDPKGNHKTLKLALKASPLLIKFILRSRQLALLNPAQGGAEMGSSGSLTRMSNMSKAIETVSGGAMPAKGTVAPKGTKISIAPAKAEPQVNKVSETFASHGFSTADNTASGARQHLFNPLYNMPHVKLQHLYSQLGDDATFRKRYLALLESFSQVLLVSEPTIITLQALLVKAFPQMLQSSVFVLDKEHTSRVLERFLSALDDADQAQLNVEKLLLLEHFQFSPYVGISILIKYIKMHARSGDEERFVALRILKSMLRSVLNQTLLGTLSATSAIATIESHPDDEMDSEYTSAVALGSTSGASAPSLTPGTVTAPPTGTAAPKQRTRISAAFGGPPVLSSTSVSSTSASSPSSTSAPPSRALYLVLLDLLPTLMRFLKKSEENDIDNRRDIATTFLAILKIVSLKRLRAQLASVRSKHHKRLLEALVQIPLLLLRYPAYPLGWTDLILYQMKVISKLIVSVVVPVVVRESGAGNLRVGQYETKVWTRLFCLCCYALRHPALQLESYVANRDSIITYLGGSDLRVTLSRALWAIWQRYEKFRMSLVPDAVPALLGLSSSPNTLLSKLARVCYLDLVGREAEILNLMTNPPQEKVYQTIRPDRPRVGSIPAIPVRIIASTPGSGTMTPSGSGSSINADALGGVEPTSRARSNNTGGNAPRPAPVAKVVGPVAAVKRAGPLASGGSSPSLNVGAARQGVQSGSVGNTGSSSSLPQSRLSSDGAGILEPGAAGMLHSSSSNNVISSTSAGGPPPAPFHMPSIEVSTIQSMEEMSKSGLWSQSHLEAFFTACKDVAFDGSPALIAALEAQAATSAAARSASLLATTDSRRSSSSGSVEPLANVKILGIDPSLLSQGLRDALLSRDPATAPSSIVPVLNELPSLRARLVEFSTDMMSLVLLLASLRDLPRGAEYDEERAYALTQLMTYLRQTQHADAYLKYAFKLSKMYEEAGQFTEAAYAVLLHADMLDWSDRVVPEMLGSTAMTSGKRKAQLLNQAIALFDKGKAWENAINVSMDLGTAYRNVLFDYPSLASQLRLQADLYMKIAEQDRFFSNYFYVAYYGTGFPNALRRKCFIYRGLELERIPHFISRMEKKFPNAEVLKTMDPPPSDLTDKNKERQGQYLQIFTVQPSSESEMNGLNKPPTWLVPNMPEGTRKYHAANNVNVFQYSRPFKQPGAPKTTDDNAFEYLWTSQVYLVTEASFPNIQRRLEIVNSSEIVRTPVENAAFAVLQKNNELSDIMAKFQASDSSIKVDRLSIVLSGILDAAVNGGTAKYLQAFLSEKFIHEHKGNKKTQDSIVMLQRALLSQIKVVGSGLNLHAELCPANLLGLHKRLESQYERMVVAIGAVTGSVEQQQPSVSPRSATSSNPSQPGKSGLPPQLPNQSTGAVRIKDADNRPSIIGFGQNM